MSEQPLPEESQAFDPSDHGIDQLSTGVDVTFAVPYVHRLRVTTNVLESQTNVLLDLLEQSGDAPARVQFWIDEAVANARPDLSQILRTFVSKNSDRVSMASNIQIAPGGEDVKNDVHVLERMLKVMNAANLDRRSYVIVIGGGAVLDAVGFAAAIAHRGIRLIRLPTTTLSQADSGVGVKNSINLFEKKNWVGSFAVPWAVINDADLLSTLPDRQFRAGFSEAVKVALLKDPALFEAICEQAERISQRDWSACGPIIQRSAEWHLKHITRGGDPFEMLEARPLDYGHWSAHKLEVMTNFQVQHGEAVAIGVAIDSLYSSRKMGFPQSDAERVVNCLLELGFDLQHPMLHDTKILFAGLEEFRQHLGGRLTLTMLRSIGDPVEIHEVDQSAMQESIVQLTEIAAAR
ncbi:3-dehydroquinate synthase [Rubinisphaera italica]|uniref:3-dehydroquinate synthase n=1 Tax=Rubinisphaera italica TaxID=2527969 RepID=A0A5C5XFN4_9PLAN|nr:3-dehydroquinate synthase [Rubinisphaera italica]TWT61459.1 3-dehydroquinate synthase [Rubinisphaera italica]